MRSAIFSGYGFDVDAGIRLEASTLTDLALAPGAIVLVTMAINETHDGRAIQFSETLLPANRVKLMLR